MNLFGRARKAPDPKESIQQLKETQTVLEKREQFLESKIKMEQDNVRRFLGQKNRRSAMMALKRSKFYQNQIEKISASRMTLETQVMALESANVNMKTMQAMQQGAQALGQIHRGMSADHVASTMDDIQDQMEVAKEITDAIAQPIGFGAELDDDDLAAELDALGEEELESRLLGAEAVPVSTLPAMTLPAVPTTSLTTPAAPVAAPPAQSAADEEMRMLEASLGV